MRGTRAYCLLNEPRMRSFILCSLFVAISAQAEVIEIHDYLPPKVQPKPVATWNPERIPAYSEAAILEDAWTRAWVLLDIDVHGRVTRFKFLNRPGHDLEPIAAHEVWSLAFDPALDDHDKARESLVVWRIEWPSHGWLMDRFGTAARTPRRNWFTGLSPIMNVPCAGSGPMQLESVHPTYRDCSMPDMTRVNVEPWIVRQ